MNNSLIDYKKKYIKYKTKYLNLCSKLGFNLEGSSSQTKYLNLYSKLGFNLEGGSSQTKYLNLYSKLGFNLEGGSSQTKYLRLKNQRGGMMAELKVDSKDDPDCTCAQIKEHDSSKRKCFNENDLHYSDPNKFFVRYNQTSNVFESSNVGSIDENYLINIAYSSRIPVSNIYNVVSDLSKIYNPSEGIKFYGMDIYHKDSKIQNCINTIVERIKREKLENCSLIFYVISHGLNDGKCIEYTNGVKGIFDDIYYHELPHEPFVIPEKFMLDFQSDFLINTGKYINEYFEIGVYDSEFSKSTEIITMLVSFKDGEDFSKNNEMHKENFVKFMNDKDYDNPKINKTYYEKIKRDMFEYWFDENKMKIKELRELYESYKSNIEIVGKYFKYITLVQSTCMSGIYFNKKVFDYITTEKPTNVNIQFMSLPYDENLYYLSKVLEQKSRTAGLRDIIMSTKSDKFITFHEDENNFTMLSKIFTCDPITDSNGKTISFTSALSIFFDTDNSYSPLLAMFRNYCPYYGSSDYESTKSNIYESYTKYLNAFETIFSEKYYITDSRNATITEVNEILRKEVLSNKEKILNYKNGTEITRISQGDINVLNGRFFHFLKNTYNVYKDIPEEQGIYEYLINLYFDSVPQNNYIMQLTGDVPTKIEDIM